MITLISTDRVIEHLLALAPEDRYTRFCSRVSDDFIRQYVSKAKGFFYGINKGVGQDRHCVALIHTIYDQRQEEMEVAVSILDDYRGKGYSKQLMYFASGIAEAYRAKKIKVSGLSRNSPMVKLAKKCGFTLTHEQGEFVGEVETIGADMDILIENNIKLFTLWRNIIT